MGRKVIIRANYRPDANFLMRLAEAVEMDARMFPERKRRILQALRVASQEMLTEENERGIKKATNA